MNPLSWSFRRQFLFGLLVCLSLLAYAVFAQYGQLYEPCPLCIFQRMAMAGVAAVALLGVIHSPRSRAGRVIYGLLAFLVAGIGAGIAGRHVWLQHLPPDQVPACGPGLAYMVESMPSYMDVLKKVLQGSGECAEVNWAWLGLSMPEWTLLCFMLLALGALNAGFRSR
ncbi:MAG: disulfide bond formation protein B [Arenimonas sp.]|nr:disulfide bond formation protein B [Arenimonas sp.]